MILIDTLKKIEEKATGDEVHVRRFYNKKFKYYYFLSTSLLLTSIIIPIEPTS